jgi:hypothetical protein
MPGCQADALSRLPTDTDDAMSDLRRTSHSTCQSGNINQHNNRRQVEPLQASTLGPAQTSTTTSA